MSEIGIRKYKFTATALSAWQYQTNTYCENRFSCHQSNSKMIKNSIKYCLSK